MSILHYFVLFIVLMLSGCGQDLRFQIRFDAATGLVTGDRLTLDDRAIGQVTAVQAEPDGSQLIGVAIAREHAAAATEDARFHVRDDPETQARKRVEMIQTRPGGKPIAEGAIVQGEHGGSPLELFPFGAILKEFGGLLRDLRGQVERFSHDFDSLPDSKEAKTLREEWRKLLEEIQKAQGSAEESLKQEVLPRLQKEMENLRKRLEEMQRASPKRGKPLET
jgi:hypothetical protein